MSEQERIDRKALLRRAVVAAGAAYVAPVLTSSATAEVDGCSLQRCGPGKKGARRCRRKGGPDCKCMDGRCRPTDCGQDGHCGPQQPCDFLRGCPDPNTGPWICFVLANSGGKTECSACSDTAPCADFIPCSKETGEGCPAGMCCFDTCCPNGICCEPAGRNGLRTSR